MPRHKKYAPRIKDNPRRRSPASMDPLHRNEVRILARMGNTTESKVLDEILSEYFKMHSPYYGAEY
jgi:hypothetical protein